MRKAAGKADTHGREHYTGTELDSPCNNSSQQAVIVCKFALDKSMMSMMAAFPPDPDLNDITLLEISKDLGIEWEQLATYLGFKAAEIQCLKIDFPHSTQNRIFQMLVKWRDRQELEVNKKDVLRQALIDIDQRIVADNHLT